MQLKLHTLLFFQSARQNKADLEKRSSNGSIVIIHFLILTLEILAFMTASFCRVIGQPFGVKGIINNALVALFRRSYLILLFYKTEVGLPIACP